MKNKNDRVIMQLTENEVGNGKDEFGLELKAGTIWNFNTYSKMAFTKFWNKKFNGFCTIKMYGCKIKPEYFEDLGTL